MNKIVLLLCLFLLIQSNNLIAQSLDSLKQLLSQPTSLAEKAILYNVLTWETQEHQQDSALRIALLAVQFAQQHQLTPQLITAELQLSDVLRVQKDFEACATHLAKAKTLIKIGSFEKEAIRLLYFEGNLAYSEYKDAEAIQLFEKCYALSKENYTCFNRKTTEVSRKYLNPLWYRDQQWPDRWIINLDFWSLKRLT